MSKVAKFHLWTLLLLFGNGVPGHGKAHSPLTMAKGLSNRESSRPFSDSNYIIQSSAEVDDGLERSRNIQKRSRRSTMQQGVYDSYRKFKPNRFPENSPEWNVAMIQYLLDMKKNGHKIREIETSKALPDLHKDLTDGGQGLLFEDPNTGEESTLKVFSQQESEDGVQIEDGPKIDPIICKMEPFNVCYRLNSKGMMHPMGDRRPVRLLRVYRK